MSEHERPKNKHLIFQKKSLKNRSLRNKISINKRPLPSIETCLNCFGTRSSDTKKNIKTTKPPVRIQNLPKFSRPPREERGGVSKMARVPEGEIFRPPHLPCMSKKLYSLLIVSIWNNLKQNTTGFRSGPIQQVPMVRYLTDAQSSNQLLMSCQCPEIILCKGKEQRRFFPTNTARYRI